MASLLGGCATAPARWRGQVLRRGLLPVVPARELVYDRGPDGAPEGVELEFYVSEASAAAGGAEQG